METEQITLEDFIDYCKRVSFIKYTEFPYFPINIFLLIFLMKDSYHKRTEIYRTQCLSDGTNAIHMQKRKI